MSSESVGIPDIVIGVDELGKNIYDLLRNVSGNHQIDYASFKRPSYRDGAPGPRVSLTGNLGTYEAFNGKHVLTVYRRKDRPTRDDVARHLGNYQRLIYNLTDSDLFGAGETDVLFPYWISGRSDHNPRTTDDPQVKRRDWGRGVESLNEARMFRDAGARRILTLHPHFHREPGVFEYGGIEVVNIDAVPAMVRYARDTYGLDENWLVVNPGLKPEREKYDIALAFAKHAGLTPEIMRMSRVADGEKTIDSGPIDADGRKVIIVDDCASTLNTVTTCVNEGIRGAPEIYVMVVAPVLPAEGIAAAENLIQRTPVVDVVGTQAINSEEYAQIPIHPIIAAYYGVESANNGH